MAHTTTAPRLKALAMLGIATTIAYSAPVMTNMGQAHASGALGFFIKDDVTAKECSACHIAYDPGLLPQGSWVRVMNDLPNHFGEDASLPEDTRTHILNYLVSHAVAGDGPMRITEQAWFKGSHLGGAWLASLFRSGPEQSMAKCDSCHAIMGTNR